MALRRSEAGLLTAIVALVVAALVAVPSVDTGVSSHPSAEPTASPTPTQPPGPPLRAGSARIASYAQGSGELVVSVTVIATGPLVAVLRTPQGSVPLTVTAESGGRVTVSGRVTLQCAAVRRGHVPALELVLSGGADQAVVELPVAEVTAAATRACADEVPVPAPTTTTRGS